MTRYGFFLFNLMLVAVLYGSVYLNGSKPGAISYVLREVSEPYMALILLMVIISTMRWFMSHDDEVEKEIVTWANALWAVPVSTIVAIYLIGGIPGSFWQGMHNLMTLR